MPAVAKAELLKPVPGGRNKARRVRVSVQVGKHVPLLVGVLLCSCGGARTRAPSAKTEPALPAVLQMPASTEDILPRAVIVSLLESVRPEFNRSDIESARRILPDQPAWLVSAGDEVCLVRLVYPLVSGPDLPPFVAHECASPSVVESGGLVTVQALVTSSGTPTPSARVVGVVPDGVSAVTIKCKSGDGVRVAVARNAYEAIVPGPIAVGFLVDARGKTRHVVVPVSSFQGGKGPSGL